MALPPVVADVPLPRVIILDVSAVRAQMEFSGVPRTVIARKWWGVHPSTAGRVLDGLAACSTQRLRLLAMALGCDPRLLIKSGRSLAA